MALCEFELALANPLAASLRFLSRRRLPSDGWPASSRVNSRDAHRDSSGDITHRHERAVSIDPAVSENGRSGLKLRDAPPYILVLVYLSPPFIRMFISIISFSRSLACCRIRLDASLKFICPPRTGNERRDTLSLSLSLFLFNIHLLCIIFHSRAVKRV